MVSILLIGYLNPRSRIPEAGNSGKDYIPIMDIAPHVNIELQGHLIHNKLPCNFTSTSHHPPSQLPCTQNTSISILNSLLILNPESQFPSRPHGPQEGPPNAPMHIPLKSWDGDIYLALRQRYSFTRTAKQKQGSTLLSLNENRSPSRPVLKKLG